MPFPGMDVESGYSFGGTTSASDAIALMFYNNCLALEALYRADHRPEKVLAIIHTQFEHEADLTSHSMSFLVEPFLCVSETVREVLASRSQVDPERMIVVPNGVEPTHFEEALPYAVMKAMAVDVPVLCTPVTDIPKFFRDGKSILFIDKNAESLAEKTKLLLEDPERGETFTQGAKRVLREHLLAETMLDRYMALLEA